MMRMETTNGASTSNSNTSCYQGPILYHLMKQHQDQDFGFYLKIDSVKGFLIAKIDDNSISASIGLKKDLIVLAINDIWLDQYLKNPDLVKQLLGVNSFECKILVVEKDVLEFHRERNIALPVENPMILRSLHDEGTSMFAETQLHPSNISPYQKLESQSHRRLKFLVLSALSIFFSISIAGTMIRRSYSQVDHFDVILNNVHNSTFNHFRVHFSENFATITTIESPYLMGDIETIVYFGQDIIAIDVEETWKIHVEDSPIKLLEVCHESKILKKYADAVEKRKDCFSDHLISKVCLPNFSLEKSSRGKRFFSLHEVICFYECDNE